MAGCADAAAGGVRGVDGDGAFDHSRAGAGASGGQQVAEDLSAEFSDEVDQQVKAELRTLGA
jgi:hypothetical protein